ncbi:DUF2835 family protein [Rheinheimera sp.]|uniref:DUF2835 family protein n=1 Tax=Rheinheimera sp. TaxID=1869214 RepID=UPI00307F9D46
MPQYRFPLLLDKAQCLAFYQGRITDVVVYASNGQTVQLPLRHFRPYMQHEGLQGYFVLTLSDDGKFEQLQKIN